MATFAGDGDVIRVPGHGLKVAEWSSPMYWMPMDDHSLVLASGPINQGALNKTLQNILSQGSEICFV